MAEPPKPPKPIHRSHHMRLVGHNLWACAYCGGEQSITQEGLRTCKLLFSQCVGTGPAKEK